MELLWLFGMSTEAYAWFWVIISVLFSILFAIGVSGGDSSSYMHDYFGVPKEYDLKNLPDEITIEIVKEKPESSTETPDDACSAPSSEQVETSLISESASFPKGKGVYLPE